MTKTIYRTSWPVYVAALISYGLCAGALGGCDGGPDPVPIPGAGSAVDAGPDQTVDVGDTVMLMGTSTGVATYKWEFVSRPEGSSAEILDERSLTQASFVADRQGDYVVKLIGAVSNNPTAPDVNPADTDTVTITAVPPGDGCAALGDRLVIVLDWDSAGVELDLGGETPEVNEPANNIGAGDPSPDKDPRCAHGGDEPTASGFTMEEAVCEGLSDPGRTYTGEWTIRVDNFDSEEQDFDLLVTIDGADVPGFPQSGTVAGAINGEGGFVDINFCLE